MSHGRARRTIWQFMDNGPTQAERVVLNAALDWIIRLPPCGPETVEPVAGRVLAADIEAPFGLPDADLAAWEGEACRARDTEGASDYAPILVSHHAVRAGDALPPGTDAVIPAALAGGAVLAPVAAGSGVLWRGGDVTPGGVALPAGLVLDPAALAMLSALGLRRVSLLRQPRVALLAPDALAPMLMTAVAQAGGIGETLPAQDGMLWARAGGFDAVLLTDASGLTQAGGKLALNVALLPEEAALGWISRAPLLLLPTLAMPCLAAFRLLAGPLVRRLAGYPDPVPVPARLTRKISSPLGVAELVWVRLAVGLATPQRVPGLAAAVGSGHVLVPPASEGFGEGAEILVWL